MALGPPPKFSDFPEDDAPVAPSGSSVPKLSDFPEDEPVTAPYYQPPRADPESAMNKYVDVLRSALPPELTDLERANEMYGIQQQTVGKPVRVEGGPKSIAQAAMEAVQQRVFTNKDLPQPSYLDNVLLNTTGMDSAALGREIDPLLHGDLQIQERLGRGREKLSTMASQAGEDAQETAGTMAYFAQPWSAPEGENASLARKIAQTAAAPLFLPARAIGALTGTGSQANQEKMSEGLAPFLTNHVQVGGDTAVMESPMMRNLRLLGATGAALTSPLDIAADRSLADTAEAITPLPGVPDAARYLADMARSEGHPLSPDSTTLPAAIKDPINWALNKAGYGKPEEAWIPIKSQDVGEGFTWQPEPGASPVTGLAIKELEKVYRGYGPVQYGQAAAQGLGADKGSLGYLAGGIVGLGADMWNPFDKVFHLPAKLNEAFGAANTARKIGIEDFGEGLLHGIENNQVDLVELMKPDLTRWAEAGGSMEDFPAFKQNPELQRNFQILWADRYAGIAPPGSEWTLPPTGKPTPGTSNPEIPTEVSATETTPRPPVQAPNRPVPIEKEVVPERPVAVKQLSEPVEILDIPQPVSPVQQIVADAIPHLPEGEASANPEVTVSQAVQSLPPDAAEELTKAVGAGDIDPAAAKAIAHAYEDGTLPPQTRAALDEATPETGIDHSEPVTADIQKLYNKAMALQAEGKGFTPEAVQAFQDYVVAYDAEVQRKYKVYTNQLQTAQADAQLRAKIEAEAPRRPETPSRPLTKRQQAARSAELLGLAEKGTATKRVKPSTRIEPMMRAKPRTIGEAIAQTPPSKEASPPPVQGFTQRLLENPDSPHQALEGMTDIPGRTFEDAFSEHGGKKGPGWAWRHPGIRKLEPDLPDVTGAKYSIRNRKTGEIKAPKSLKVALQEMLLGKNVYDEVIVTGSNRVVADWSAPNRASRVPHGQAKPHHFGAGPAERQLIAEKVAPPEGAKRSGTPWNQIAPDKLRKQLVEGGDLVELHAGMPVPFPRTKSTAQAAIRRVLGKALPAADKSRLTPLQLAQVDTAEEAMRMFVRNRLGDDKLVSLETGHMVTPVEAKRIIPKFWQELKDWGVDPRKFNDPAVGRQAEILRYKYGVKDPVTTKAGIVTPDGWTRLRTAMFDKMLGQSAKAQYNLRQTRALANIAGTAFVNAAQQEPARISAVGAQVKNGFLQEVLRWDSKHYASRQAKELLDGVENRLFGNLSELVREVRNESKRLKSKGLAKDDAGILMDKIWEAWDPVLPTEERVIDPLSSMPLVDKRNAILDQAGGSLRPGEMGLKSTNPMEWAAGFQAYQTRRLNELSSWKQNFLKSFYPGLSQEAFSLGLEKIQEAGQSHLLDEAYARFVQHGDFSPALKTLGETGFPELTPIKQEHALTNFATKLRADQVLVEAVGEMLHKKLALSPDDALFPVVQDLLTGHWREKVDGNYRIKYSPTEVALGELYLGRHGLQPNLGVTRMVKIGPENARVYVPDYVAELFNEAKQAGILKLEDESNLSKFIGTLRMLAKVDKVAGWMIPKPQKTLNDVLDGIQGIYRVLGGEGLAGTGKAYLQHPRIVSKLIQRFSRYNDGIVGRWLWPHSMDGVNDLVHSPTGRVYTLDDIENLMGREGVQTSAARAETRADLVQDLRTADAPTWKRFFGLGGVKEVGKSAAEFLSPKGWWNQALIEVPHLVESTYRTGVFVDALKKGLSPAEAGRLARESLFDWNKMTPFERKTMRSMFWFYAFERKNIDQNLKTFFKNPDRTVKLLRYQMDQRDVWGQSDLIQSGMTPDQFFRWVIHYKADPGVLPKHMVEGKEQSLQEGSTVSALRTLTSLFGALQGDPDSLGYLSQRLNPLGTSTLIPALATDRDPLTGRPIADDRNAIMPPMFASPSFLNILAPFLRPGKREVSEDNPLIKYAVKDELGRNVVYLAGEGDYTDAQIMSARRNWWLLKEFLGSTVYRVGQFGQRPESVTPEDRVWEQFFRVSPVPTGEETLREQARQDERNINKETSTLSPRVAQ